MKKELLNSNKAYCEYFITWRQTAAEYYSVFTFKFVLYEALSAMEQR